MIKKTLFSLSICFITLVLYNANDAHTYSSTPPANRTGAPGSAGTCVNCHGGGADISIDFNNGGLDYTADGNTYPIAVTINGTSPSRFGFSMVAFDSNNDDVGTLVASGANTQIYNGNHIGHQSAPTGSGPYTFNFDWQAPTNGAGDVTFYLACVAANNNGQTTGDEAAITTLTISEMTVSNPTLLTKAKVFLEGAYASGGMLSTNLELVVPVNQPYNETPWQYVGVEPSVNLPTNVTDWVLVELRAANDVNTLVATRAAWLRNDGMLVDMDGSEGIGFENQVDGDYYLVIRHRNHLDVLSSTVVNLPNATPYDFTQSATTVMGDDQLVDVGDGNFAMLAGDINGDGVISVSDFNVYITQAALINEYLPSDTDLDGNVTVSDFNLYRPNVSIIGVNAVRY